MGTSAPSSLINGVVPVGWGEATPFKVFFLAFLQAHVRLQYDGFVWRFFLLAVASLGLVFSWDTLRVSLDRPAL
jgi:hypothetical protein